MYFYHSWMTWCETCSFIFWGREVLQCTNLTFMHVWHQNTKHELRQKTRSDLKSCIVPNIKKETFHFGVELVGQDRKNVIKYLHTNARHRCDWLEVGSGAADGSDERTTPKPQLKSEARCCGSSFCSPLNRSEVLSDIMLVWNDLSRLFCTSEKVIECNVLPRKVMQNCGLPALSKGPVLCRSSDIINHLTSWYKVFTWLFLTEGLFGSQ